MRFYEIGLDADGRPAVVSSREIEAPAQARAAGQGADWLWRTHQQPIELPVPRRPLDGAYRDIGIKPDATSWLIFTLAPNQTVAHHFTTTLDYDFVHAGEVRLLLGDDELVLRPGDGVMVPGVEHGWAAGPQGSVMSVVTLGFAPPG